jgi:transcriptional regulator with XRE-family HTH domain
MIVARFKQATGMSDRELATLLGVARSTVQAGLAGKLRLKIPDATRAALLAVVTDRQQALAALAHDLTPRQDC